jgi:hypothetical protein
MRSARAEEARRGRLSSPGYSPASAVSMSPANERTAPTKCHRVVTTLTRRSGNLTHMEHLWTEIDEAVLQCLAHGVAGPAEIGEQLGMSEAAAASILAMLAAEGKVRICGARLS